MKNIQDVIPKQDATPKLVIIKPSHPSWEGFYKRLSGPEGCNFHKNDEGTIVWDCDGHGDLSKSKRILEVMKMQSIWVDVEGSLQYFREHGGHCDCEVLMNVDPKKKVK